MEGSKVTWLQYYILLLQTLCHITTESWWKGAERPDFNTVYCYHRRRGAKRLDFNTIYCYHRRKGAKWSDFNIVYYYHRRKGAKWPDFNYTTTTEGREQSDLTSILYTVTTEEREQSDLTSTLCHLLPQKERSKATWLQYYILLLQTMYHITTESWWKGAKRPDFNTVYC